MRARRILICPDSFKGSLTADAAARAMAAGTRTALPMATITRVPLADGGEGTFAVLRQVAGARSCRVRVPGPLGRTVTVRLLLLPRRTAVVEMAQAAGLLLVPESARDPLRANTFGVGLMIAQAVRVGAARIFVTLGGSATTDGGTGMARALGARFLDDDGRDLPPGGGSLTRLARIDASRLRRYPGVTILGATDVLNPLLGPRGAAPVFAPQKGATGSQVRRLAAGLATLARILRRDLHRDIGRIPRGGAAGGLGAGLSVFADARLVSGADLIFSLLGLERIIAQSDLVLTGEGSLDAQTTQGKLVARVAARARRAGVPVFAFAGRMTLDAASVRRLGLTAAFPITPPGMPPRDAFRRAGPLLTAAVTRALRGI